MATKRVAVYIRVSTKEQAKEGYSLAAQQRVIESWAKSHKYIIGHVYPDEGRSGKDIVHRPYMQQLLRDVQHNMYDIVAVWALSRLTRNVADLYNILDTCQRHNVVLVSCTEPFDISTPIGRVMVGMLGIFAQFELENTGERVRIAMSERAAQGKRTCNEVLGYDLYGSDSLQINPAEAKRVRYIFSKYLEHSNLLVVADLCAVKGYCGKRGKQFRAQNIKTILTRPIYAGYNSYRGVLHKGDFDPIIDLATYNRVQLLLGGKQITTKQDIDNL